MTYNFDPERWYENEAALLQRRQRRGRMTPAEFECAMKALQRRYEAMLDRLDGTYQLPSAEDAPSLPPRENSR